MGIAAGNNSWASLLSGWGRLVCSLLPLTCGECSQDRESAAVCAGDSAPGGLRGGPLIREIKSCCRRALPDGSGTLFPGSGGAAGCGGQACPFNCPPDGPSAWDTPSSGHHAPRVQSLCVQVGPGWASVLTCALNTRSLTPQVHGRHQGSRDRSGPPTNVTIPKTHPLVYGFVDGLPGQLTCEAHSWQRAFGDEEERIPVRQLL